MTDKHDFQTGDFVDRKIDPVFNRWSEGWKVIEMPSDFTPLGDCVYVEKNGHISGVPPVHLRQAVNPKGD